MGPGDEEMANLLWVWVDDRYLSQDQEAEDPNLWVDHGVGCIPRDLFFFCFSGLGGFCGLGCKADQRRLNSLFINSGGHLLCTWCMIFSVSIFLFLLSDPICRA